MGGIKHQIIQKGKETKTSEQLLFSTSAGAVGMSPSQAGFANSFSSVYPSPILYFASSFLSQRVSVTGGWLCPPGGWLKGPGPKWKVVWSFSKEHSSVSALRPRALGLSSERASTLQSASCCLCGKTGATKGLWETLALPTHERTWTKPAGAGVPKVELQKQIPKHSRVGGVETQNPMDLHRRILGLGEARQLGGQRRPGPHTRSASPGVPLPAEIISKELW